MKSVSKILNSNISQQLFYLLVLVLFLRIDLVFENNTPTGGDMGAHIVAIDTFIKDISKKRLNTAQAISHAACSVASKQRINKIKSVNERIYYD